MTTEKATWVGLPKWPQLVVVGEPVTTDQAAEIILRTAQVPFYGNDNQWVDWLHGTIGYKPIELTDPGDKWLAQLEHLRGDLAIVDCEYLHNCRITSCYFQGPHGWVDWSGNVGCFAFNIGKWPSADCVLESWSNIAKAFPFLDLRAQLFDREECEAGGRPVIEYVVAKGEAIAREPEGVLRSSFSGVSETFDSAMATILMGAPGRERGCSEEQFLRAVELARAAGRRVSTGSSE